jgi:hypothetical protein
VVKKLSEDELEKEYQENARIIYNKIQYYFNEQGLSEKWLAEVVFTKTKAPKKSLDSFLERLKAGENVNYVSLFRILKVLGIEDIKI